MSTMTSARPWLRPPEPGERVPGREQSAYIFEVVLQSIKRRTENTSSTWRRQDDEGVLCWHLSDGRKIFCPDYVSPDRGWSLLRELAECDSEMCELVIEKLELRYGSVSKMLLAPESVYGFLKHLCEAIVEVAASLCANS